MILGIGHDIIEMERVKRAFQQEGFLARYFTSKELEQLGSKKMGLAGNFCVKEAVAKAFGTGFRGFGLQDIEVLRDGLGKPVVSLYGNARELADSMGVKRIFASITNINDLASAVVVLEGSDE